MWLKPENRCLVPFNSFAEYAPEPNPETKKKDVVWFALNDDRPLFAFAFIIYVWKVVVWDKVLGLGATGALPDEMGQWAMIVLTAYFGGRSIEKVARILARK
jgi:putative SOS response-associated peptidase YedK